MDKHPMYSFIADYLDGNGEPYYRCFQVMDPNGEGEESAAATIRAGLSDEGMTLRVLTCVHGGTTLGELQRLADSGTIPARFGG